MKKGSRNIIYSLIILTSAFAGMVLQKNLFTQKQVIDVGKSIEKIAIVNMDDGIKKDGKPINYATQLMESDSDFVLTSLSDAREGVKEGNYAAYVIIPENFSVAVDSINKTPEIAVLTYELNPELNIDAKEDTIHKVNSFEKAIDYKVGYIYLTSILTEFHSGQQEVSQVLLNDEKNQEVISEVENIDLTISLEIQPMEQIENTITSLSLEEEISYNKQVVEDIKTTLRTSKEELQGQYNEVNTQVDSYIKQVETIDVLKNADGMNVYDIAPLEQFLTIHRENPNVLTTYMDEVITTTLSKAQLEFQSTVINNWKQRQSQNSSFLEKGETLLLLKGVEWDNLKELILNLESDNPQIVQESIEELTLLFGSDNSNEVITEIEYQDIVDINTFEPREEDFIIDMEALKTALFQSEKILNTSSLKNVLYDSESGVIQISIIDKINNNQMIFKENLESIQKQNIYSTREQLDLDRILSNEINVVSTYGNTLNNTTNTIVDKVTNQEQSYLAYILENKEAVTNYSNNLVTLIGDNKAQSDALITSRLENAKETILYSGIENLQILQSFTSKLPYSKQGENQNKEVKDHILEPTDTSLTNKSMTSVVTEETLTFLEDNWMIMVNSVLGCLLLGTVGYMIYTKNKRLR
ncbi:MAG: hypothetical protein ACK5LC_17265 [Coprobacillaceae bacterium]